MHPSWNEHRHRLKDQFCRLEKNVRQKMMLAFEDVDGKLEAYSDELSKQHITSNNPSFQEGEYKAELHALYEDELRTAQCDVAAFAVAALYHHWERSVKWLIARRHRPGTVPGLDGANFEKLKEHLKFKDLPDECRFSFDNIDLGRLIANVIKHGQGSAAKGLQKKAPEIFIRPWNDDNFDLPSDHGVNLIWVQPSHVCAVADAISRFWQTLPDDHFPSNPPFTLDALCDE